ncbi:type II toxin-antitoxin system ParD family antitoxin [Rhizobium sp. HT1-10]|uniref:type II toxin-antitoxin system ParD family antitoxin n=1 Tax=Rhizobium sp. HT1-10 TaxID=3111638 RepID=UPI003C260BE9
MTKVVSVTLDPQMNEFIDAQVTGGFYGSTAEVVEAALRLLRDHAEIEAIRAAIIEGEESGEPEPFDFDEFLDEMRRKHGR